MKSLSDTELVSLYQSGNGKAFATLLNRHKSKVYTTIYFIVKDRELSEDLTQDVFCKVVDKITAGKYNDEGKFQAWIVRMAHNLAIDHFRRSKRYPTFSIDEGSAMLQVNRISEAPRELIQIQEETHYKLRELIKNLPQTQKEVLLMRHFADMSFKEIADFTGVSINTALGRMRYALINLRKQLENDATYDHKLYPV